MVTLAGGAPEPKGVHWEKGISPINGLLDLSPFPALFAGLRESYPTPNL